MEPHFIEIRHRETQQSIIVDMEGPYHPKNKRIGEHIYGETKISKMIHEVHEPLLPQRHEVKI